MVSKEPKDASILATTQAHYETVEDLIQATPDVAAHYCNWRFTAREQWPSGESDSIYAVFDLLHTGNDLHTRATPPKTTYLGKVKVEPLSPQDRYTGLAINRDGKMYRIVADDVIPENDLRHVFGNLTTRIAEIERMPHERLSAHFSVRMDMRQLGNILTIDTTRRLTKMTPLDILPPIYLTGRESVSDIEEKAAAFFQGLPANKIFKIY